MCDSLYPHSKSLRKHCFSHTLETRKWSLSPMKFNTWWSQTHALIWGLANTTMIRKYLSATARVLRCDKIHGQEQRNSWLQYPGGKVRLPGLVSLPVDLRTCSLSSLSKLRPGNGGRKGSLPTEERRRDSNGLFCVMSVTMKRRLGMDRQSHQGLQKAPITEYSLCLYPKGLRGQDTSQNSSVQMLLLEQTLPAPHSRPRAITMCLTHAGGLWGH